MERKNVVEKILGLLLVAGACICDITDYKRVCYFTSWSGYRPDAGRFTADDITDSTLCTHYIYSFAGVDNKTIIPLDVDRDEKGGYEELTNLKKTNPDIKVMLTVGGYSFGVERFVTLTKHDGDIEEFCNNTVQYLRKWNFDGLDVDWEYPTQRGGELEDKHRFVTLLQKLRSSFEIESNVTGKHRLLLSSAVPISKTVIDQGYNRTAIGDAVDFLNVMVYDLYGGWSKTIGHHAPLSYNVNSSENDKMLNAKWGMGYWAEEVPKKKLILGLPLYARTFTLYNSTLNNVGDPNNGSGSPGPYTQALGVLSYYEVCKLIKADIVSEQWDEETNAPYSVSDTEFITYDDQRSVKSKVNFVKDEQYGGIMVWEMSFDDFTGRFCEEGGFPLLNTIKYTLTHSRDECPEGSYGKLNSKGCTRCRRNFYQPEPNQLDCLSCPLGEVTLTHGARGRYECILDCASGTEFDYTKHQCVPCPMSYFRRKPDSAVCVKCTSGLTTVSTGSTACVKAPKEYTSKQIQNNMTLTFVIKMVVKSCSNMELLQEVVLGAVRETLDTALKQWSGICTEGCSNIKLGKDTGCDARQKRDTEEESQWKLKIVLENVPDEIYNGDVTRPTKSVLNEILNNRHQFSKLNKYKLRYEGVESMSSRVICPLPNHAVQNNQCVPCEKGTYFNPLTADCSECGLGTYQDVKASSSCKPCPGVLTTAAIGSKSRSLCVSQCQVNPSYCRNGGECVYNNTVINCRCAPGFRGKHCEEKIVLPGDKDMMILLSVGGCIGVLVIVLIIVTSCACWRYSRRPRRYEELKEKLRNMKIKERCNGRGYGNTSS